METLLEVSCQTTGEGPHWDDRTGQLLYVDINDGVVQRWTAATGINEKHKFGILMQSIIINKYWTKRIY